MEKNTNNNKLINNICLLLISMACCSTYQLSGIFYTAHLYKHPQTGNTLWLFSDVHRDVDDLDNLTRMHQKQLLDEAKKQNAFLIAEGVRADLDRVVRFMEKTLNPLLASIFITKTVIDFYEYNSYFEKMFTSSTFFLSFIAYEEITKYKNRKTTPYTVHIQQLKQKYATSLIPLHEVSPLVDIIYEATQRGIQNINIEFRHRPYYNDLSIRIGRQVARFFTRDSFRYPITLADYQAVLTATVEEILNYNSTNICLLDWYRNVVQLYKEANVTKAFYAIATLNPSLAFHEAIPFVQKMFKLDEQETRNQLLMFDCTLLDARIVRSIELNKDKDKSLFVCAGGYHIKNIIHAIEILGYEKVHVSGENNHTYIFESSKIHFANNTMNVQGLDHIVINLETFFEEAHAKLAQAS